MEINRSVSTLGETLTVRVVSLGVYLVRLQLLCRVTLANNY